MAPVRPSTFMSVIDGDRRGVGATAARAALWWARLPYGVAVRLRDAAFRKGWKKVHRVPVPVVCVGNLTLGGTGKTPCVEYVARFFRDQGVAVGLLSRGYGASAGANDEALLLEENLPDAPHLQGADRVTLAGIAVDELESELLVLDDGFQHRRLGRDLDIVLLDATRPLADDYLFPRGTLREPSTGLRRAHFVIFTRCDHASPESLERQIGWLKAHYPSLPYATACHEPLPMPGRELPPDEEWAGRPVAAFCGLGNPASFRRTLERFGATVHDFRVYPDHHAYTRDDVAELRRWAGALPAGSMVATTQKDWVKLRIDELGGKTLVSVRAGLKFLSGEEVFRERLLGLVPAPREWGKDEGEARAA